MMRTTPLTIGASVIVALLAGAPLAHAQAGATAPQADPREINLRAYVELLRSDLRAQKVAVIAEVMEFTEKEDAAFWPVYREYEAELAKINSDRMSLIKDYAKGFDTLTDATADGFAVRALGLEARRQTLLENFYKRFKAVVPAKTAARFLQVEHQILLLMDLQIAASLPVVER
jgi:hypothetical protein